MKILAAFSQAVARHVYPAMARQGLHRKGKRTWWERRDDGSCVVLEIQMSKWVTHAELGFTVNTAAWPPGTWQHLQSEHTYLATEECPFATGAPFWSRPNGVAPELWLCDDDFRYVDLSADQERVAVELRDFLLAGLAWARERSGSPA